MSAARDKASHVLLLPESTFSAKLWANLVVNVCARCGKALQLILALVLASSVPQCPLCMEPLELDDQNFYPCSCGYQVSRFAAPLSTR